MIFICSDDDEPTTDTVCVWLNHFGKEFIRISQKDTISIHAVYLSDGEFEIEFSVKDSRLKMSEITSYWYRRSKLSFAPLDKINYIEDGRDYSREINFALNHEYETLKSFFEFCLDEKAKLNRHKDNQVNKLEVLKKARELGLNIPNSIIGTEKSHFNQFSGQNTITKAIGDFYAIRNGKPSHSLATSRFDLHELPNEEFSFTLLQNEIRKKYELRIFYIQGEFFSTAIFSQADEKTELDFRNYNFEKPNRVVPHKLPQDLESKLQNLMDYFEYNSGSIDIAYTSQNQYVLFEINPIGQFEQVSIPGNYNLPKIIAQKL